MIGLEIYVNWNGGATGNRTPIPWMQTTCSPVKLWPQG